MELSKYIISVINLIALLCVGPVFVSWIEAATSILRFVHNVL